MKINKSKKQTTIGKRVDVNICESNERWDGGYHASMGHMIGVVFTSVGMVNGDEELHFHCADGTFVLYHSQSCCEHVYIEDIVGDLSDLVGTPLLQAEESTSEHRAPPEGRNPDSYTWTFYKFATIKGYVDVRWFGSSNGFYSERVDLKFIPK